MKKLFFLFLSVGFCSNSFAQEAIIGSNYYFKSSLSKAITDQKMALNTSDPLNGQVIEYKKIVKVVNVEGGRVYFKYLEFVSSDGTDAEKQIVSTYNTKYNSDGNGDFTFSMSEEDFSRLTSLRYSFFRNFQYGTYTVPIRIRSHKSNFEFDSNLSLGANVLGRFSLSNYKENAYFDFSVGVSLTKVNLNKDNSLLGTEGSDFEDVETLSPAAFTLSTGVLFNLAENVNIGIYLGWDFLSSADNKAEWIYNRKTWMGIGLNVAFQGGNANTGGGSNTL